MTDIQSELLSGQFSKMEQRAAIELERADLDEEMVGAYLLILDHALAREYPHVARACREGLARALVQTLGARERGPACFRLLIFYAAVHPDDNDDGPGPRQLSRKIMGKGTAQR